MTGTYDVLTAGGGPAGLTLALALARRGFSVAVADAAAPVHTASGEGRAWFIAHGCWRIFAALGLGEDLAASAEPVEKVEARGPAGGASFLAGEAGEAGPLGFMINERVLTGALAAAVSREKGVRVIARARISGVTFGDPFAIAATDAGEVRARLVVGCDGARSAVREAAGIRFEGHDYAAKTVSAMLKLARPHGGAARQIFLKTGPLAVLPLRGNRANLVWTHKAAAADALVAMSDEDFAKELAAQAGEFIGGFELDGARAAYPLRLRVAERFHGPRMALAGDAAHVVHPLAGQGLNLGLKDVAALADVISEAVHVGLDIGSEVALAPYTRWRRADVVAMAAAMETFARVFTAPEPVRVAASLAMQAADSVKPLRNLFSREAGAVLGETPSLMRA